MKTAGHTGPAGPAGRRGRGAHGASAGRAGRRAGRGARWAAALALLPALLGTAACGSTTGTGAEAGEAVYGRPLAEQFRAATDATRQAGTARFTSTLTYGTAAGEAVQSTKGRQDYAAGTALATLSLAVDKDFPESSAAFLGQPGTTVEHTLATAADDVYFRNDARSDWLRYTPAAVTGLGEPTSALSAHAAGDAAPYSGTLADLVPRTVPRQAPQRNADGSRTYRVTALAEAAADLLPPGLHTGESGWGAEPVRLTVRLDTEGRLAEATADLGPILTGLHKSKVLTGVTSLRASYAASAYGDPVPYRLPGKDGAGVEDAGTVLAPVASLKRGRCGATDTGLGTVAVVRPVDCAERHDIRVFAQTAVDRTFPGEQTAKDGNDFAEEQCGRAYAAAPKEWQRDGRPAGRFAFTGSSSVNVSVGETTQTSVTGEFTCYVVTS